MHGAQRHFKVLCSVEPEGEPFDAEDEVEKVFSIMTTELMNLVEDPIVSGSLATGEVEVILIAEGSSPNEAVQNADSAVRAAFHAAECHTEDWQAVHALDETPRMRLDWLRYKVVPADA